MRQDTHGLLAPGVRFLQALTLKRRAVVLYGLLAIPTLLLGIDKIDAGWRNVQLLHRAQAGADYARAALALSRVADSESNRLSDAGLSAADFSLETGFDQLERAFGDLQARHRVAGVLLNLQDPFAELSRLYVLASSTTDLAVSSRIGNRVRLRELSVRLASTAVSGSGLANKDWRGTSELANLRLEVFPRFVHALGQLDDDRSDPVQTEASDARRARALRDAGGEFGALRSGIRRLAARHGIRCQPGQDDVLDRLERRLASAERSAATGAAGGVAVAARTDPGLTAAVLDLELGCDAALSRQIDAAEARQRREFIGLLAGLAALYALAVYLISAGLSLDRDGIVRIRQTVEHLGKGDLRPKTVPTGADDLSETLRRMSRSTGQLADLLASVKQNVGAVAHTSTEVARASQSLSRSSTATSGQLREFGNLFTRLAGQIDAQDAAFAEGVERAAHMVAEAGRGNRAVTSLEERIAQLQLKGREIAKIVGVIEGISHQTNLLSLNAAIQASKAGESGKGFAVVAQEVRSLAQRVGQAAQHIGGVVAASEQDIEQGHHMVKRTRDAVLATDGHVRAVGGILERLSHASQATNQNIDDIRSAMTKLEEGNHSNGRVADQMAQASTHLRAKAQNLSDELSMIKLSN